MKIIAEQVQSKELVPGDLFSNVGPSYWDNHWKNMSIGEKVYIRTEEPCPEDQALDIVYKITIN